MHSVVTDRVRGKKERLSSFTLVELLTVIAIIAILVGLVLSASSGVWMAAARNRAQGELRAMGAALDSYKADNGNYPQYGNLPTTAYASTDGSVAGGLYQLSSQVLYQGLSGQINFLDTPTTGVKSYMTFKRNQVGNAKATANSGYNATTSTYVQDPWGYSYGYSTGNSTTPNYPYSGNGFYDVWTTGGALHTSTTFTNAWIANWNQ